MTDLSIGPIKPARPFGTCFDSAAEMILTADGDVKMCHGVGVANKPGEVGEDIAHAWIELFDEEHGEVAVDPIWHIAQPAAIYRKNLKLELVVVYSKAEFMELWRQKEFPGPWDERIYAFTKEGKLERETVEIKKIT